MPILKRNCIVILQSTTNQKDLACIPDDLQPVISLFSRHDAHEHLPKNTETMKIEEITGKMNFRNENEILLDEYVKFI
jgi:hypothetical protein